MKKPTKPSSRPTPAQTSDMYRQPTIGQTTPRTPRGGTSASAVPVESSSAHRRERGGMDEGNLYSYNRTLDIERFDNCGVQPTPKPSLAMPSSRPISARTPQAPRPLPKHRPGDTVGAGLASGGLDSARLSRPSTARSNLQHAAPYVDASSEYTFGNYEPPKQDDTEGVGEHRPRSRRPDVEGEVSSAFKTFAQRTAEVLQAALR